MSKKIKISFPEPTPTRCVLMEKCFWVEICLFQYEGWWHSDFIGKKFLVRNCANTVFFRLGLVYERTDLYEVLFYDFLNTKSHGNLIGRTILKRDCKRIK